MVNYSVTLDDIYFALSSDIRRKIIEIVSIGPVASSELATRLGLSLPALHKHTKVLLQTKLIKKTKKGRVAYLVFEPGSLDAAEDWMAEHKRFWNDNLQNLEDYFNDKEQ